MAQIRSICDTETANLNAGLYWYDYKNLQMYQRDLKDLGWRFYVVDQTRGFCRPNGKIITIPLWCVKRAITKASKDRLVQYIIHECAHAFDYINGNRELGHGEAFMKTLMSICPRELLVYEMTYKPKNLVKAGAVFCPDSLNF